MARVCIAYAHPSGEPGQEHALAVLAQDQQTVVLVPVHRNLVALASALGLPSQTFVGWAEVQQARIRPLLLPHGRQGGSEEVPVTDIRWLESFTAPSQMMTVSWGAVREVPGRAADVAAAKARELAGSGPGA